MKREDIIRDIHALDAELAALEEQYGLLSADFYHCYGHDSVRVTLGGETIRLDLKPGDKAQGARLDRFGLFSTLRGGNLVKIWFDDLRYTAGWKSP